MTTVKVQFDALDALRGLAILMMVFSGTIPFGGALSGWMYHAQLPPPSHAFNPDMPGITWVDMVFPMFLFSMGVAIPFSFGSRKDRGVSNLRILGHLLWRFLGLVLFAVVSHHFRPWNMDVATPWNWVLALVGMLLMLVVFAAPAKGWNFKYGSLIPAGGLILVAMFLFVLHQKGVEAFSIHSFDIIIMVLANTALAGGALYLLFRRWDAALWTGFALMASFFLAARDGNNWVSNIYNWSPVSWLLSWNYLKYLLVLIPGIFTGVVCRDALKNAAAYPHPPKGRLGREWGMLFLSLGVVVVSVVGLYLRHMALTMGITILLLVPLLVLVKSWKGIWGRVFKILMPVMIVLILAGYLLEPLHGGIKKDPATFSYLLLTAGLSMVMLLALVVIIDVFKWKRWLIVLTGSGKNPMMAYVAGSNLVMSVFALTGINYLFEWGGESVVPTVVKAVSITLCVGWLSAVSAQKKFFMKV
ncbi:MAG: DUF5009 domain-containing protein [Spirochaetales bacterium]|jgi:predicted acyltransferase|nr:DUF5009 domain-containing protein [Spirochaetales bacterium]